MTLHLTRTEENAAEIDALADSLAPYGGGRVGLSGVLDDLDRRARRTLAPGLAVRRALTWSRADNADPTWYPQGITTSHGTDAGSDSDRDLLLVSWYSKTGWGSRITVLDLASRRYRHVLLVEPTVIDGRAGVQPVAVHAGGLVWQAGNVHVAATRRGFLTCRLDDLLHDPSNRHGAPYLLPVRFAYRAAAEEGTELLRYSFLALDRSGPAPALVVGEYARRDQTRRLVRFALEEESGLLAADPSGISRALEVSEEGERQMQGVAVVGGTHYVTVSHGPWRPGTVLAGRPGSFRRHRWATPMGPEDLTYHPPTDRLWSVTEHPHRRWVFAMRRPSGA
ncbi:MAG TPA: hypothetical protein VGE38_11865 [Nocardioides sp.]|uniref:hypothetical protein n=1 Tax=Nocardioides sp. TaxID=35761 RepID=UPI002ED8369C